MAGETPDLPVLDGYRAGRPRPYGNRELAGERVDTRVRPYNAG